MTLFLELQIIINGVHVRRIEVCHVNDTETTINVISFVVVPQIQVLVFTQLRTDRKTCDSKESRWHQPCHIADSFVTQPLLRRLDFPFFMVDALSLSIRDLLRYGAIFTAPQHDLFPSNSYFVWHCFLLSFIQYRDWTNNACQIFNLSVI